LDDCIELNQMNLVPVIPQNWADPVAISVNWTISFTDDATGVNRAFFRNVSYTPPPSDGFGLWNAVQNITIAPAQNPLYLDVPANSTIEFIINNFDGGEHPIHLHGHNFAVLGGGLGVYDGTQQSQLKTINPPRRDVIGVPASGWVVIRFKADNPGVWPFHCHIDWHFQAGLAATIIERPKDLVGKPLPQDLVNLCKKHPPKPHPNPN